MKRKIVNIVLMAAMLLNIFGALTAFADDVVYDDRYMATFTDDFSGGLDMTKWLPNSSDGTTLCTVEDGKLKIAGQKAWDGVRPNVDNMPLANVSYQFEATGMDKTPLRVVFGAAESTTNSLSIFIADKTSTDWRKCVAINNINSNGEAGAVAAPGYEYDGGMGDGETPKTHTIKVSITSDYTVKVYVDDMTEPVISKTQSDLNLTLTGMYKSPALHYGESTVATPATRIDNVKLTYPAPKVYGTAEHTYEENFDSADWKSDWTSSSASAADTYDATNGMVTLAEQAMFPNGVSGTKLKASLTVDTAAAVDGGNYGLYMRFENVENSSDKVSIAVSGTDDVVYVYTGTQSGWQATNVTLSAVASDKQLKLSSWDKNNYYTQTYVFELTGESLLITEMNNDRKTGSTASTAKKEMYLPNFSTYFTPGAEYKVGLTQYGTGTVKVDKFTVDVTEPVPGRKVEFGGNTFEADFSSETWYENWLGAIGSNGNVQYTAKDGKIYPQDGRVMYANGISGEEMTVELTIGGASGVAGADSIGVYFVNSSNENDYVYFFFNPNDSNKPYLVADGKEGGTRAFNGAAFSASETDPQTYTFKLTDESFTLTKGTTTHNFEYASLFTNYFTEGANYKVGIISIGCVENDTIYIDNFKVETPDTNAVSVSLQAEVAEDTYGSVSKVEAGVNYKVTLSTEKAIDDAVYMAAVYDGDRFIDVHMLTAGEAHEVLIPFGAEAPELKVFAWENLTTLKPIVPVFAY